MKARIVKIGNSQGIRLPNPLVEQAGLVEEVMIEVQESRLIITHAARPRALWAAVFKEMAGRGDDMLLDGDVPMGKGASYSPPFDQDDRNR